MLSIRPQDAVSDTLSPGPGGKLPLVEWIAEIEWFADGSTCFLLIFLAARAADVQGRAMKDTFPPKLPSISWSDLEINMKNVNKQYS
jgi:hypothetical protein